MWKEKLRLVLTVSPQNYNTATRTDKKEQHTYGDNAYNTENWPKEFRHNVMLVQWLDLEATAAAAADDEKARIKLEIFVNK